MLNDKKILLGVTGGIAAYKACALTSLLVKKDCQVNVLMTPNAQKFVGAATFQALTHRHVYVDTFDTYAPECVHHIKLPEGADAFVIAPATANTIAKIAHGIADNLLTSAALVAQGVKIIAPAMNTMMYENPATQENLHTLERHGWNIIEPVQGRLACGTTGKGKMSEPEEILQTIEHIIAFPHDMAGENVIVTAGPTQESIDPVRYLTNHSTGRMGFEIAKAAADRGANVTLISGPTSLTPPKYVELVKVTTAKDMFEAVTAHFANASIVVKAAAVADYRPIQVSANKIKKKDGDLNLPLERTQDILKHLGEHRTSQIICGFSMETENLIENSRAKLEKKKVQLIAANSLRDKGAGFGTSTNIVTLITKDDTTELPIMGKDLVAHKILDKIMQIKKDIHAK